MRFLVAAGIAAILAIATGVATVLAAEHVVDRLVGVTRKGATNLVEATEALANNTLASVGDRTNGLIACHEEVADRGI